MSTRFSRGMSTPAIRAIPYYPCRCLCFGSEQITRICRSRRMILHLSQRFLTDALTFTVALIPDPSRNSPSLEVIWRQLDEHLVARHDANEVHPHLAADVRQHRVSLLELDLEHRVRKCLGNGPFHLDDLFVA